jgi:hypothetical protein
MPTKKTKVATKKPAAKKKKVPKAVKVKKVIIKKKKPVVKKVSVKKKATKKKPVVKAAAKKEADLTVEVQKEFLVVHSCNNCEHMPVTVGKLVGIFTFIIAVLSTVILIQLGLINLEQVLMAVSTPVNAATEWVNSVR